MSIGRIWAFGEFTQMTGMGKLQAFRDQVATGRNGSIVRIRIWAIDRPLTGNGANVSRPRLTQPVRSDLTHHNYLSLPNASPLKFDRVYDGGDTAPCVLAEVLVIPSQPSVNLDTDRRFTPKLAVLE